MSPMQRVLISRPNVRLGNTLMLTPLLTELRQRLPHARVDVLTACQDADRIFSAFDNVNSVIQLPRHGVRHPWHFLTQLKNIAQGYDLALDPCPKSCSSRLYTRLARAGQRAGFISDSKPADASMRSVAFTQAPRHMAQYPVYLLRQALQLTDTPDYPRMSILLAPDELAWGQEHMRQLFPNLAAKAPILGFFPGATGAKQLPASWWQNLLANMHADTPDLRVLEIVAPGTKAFLPKSDRHALFGSSDIRQLAAVISAARAFVVCDGGIMHLAACTSTPVLGLFTYTSPQTYRPFNCTSSCAMSVNIDSVTEVALRLQTVIAGSGVTNTTDRQLPVGDVLAYAG